VSTVHQHLVTCAPSVSQRAAVAAFTPEGLRERRRYLEIFRRRRDLMAEELSRLQGVAFDLPDGAFYFFVDVSSHGDDLELSRRILGRQGVITIPGRAFGEGGRGNLRLSFAASDEDIRRGIEGIRAELER
jgi:aspartate/methionine/tyrosine aminotransferase